MTKGTPLLYNKVKVTKINGLFMRKCQHKGVHKNSNNIMTQQTLRKHIFLCFSDNKMAEIKI